MLGLLVVLGLAPRAHAQALDPHAPDPHAAPARKVINVERSDPSLPPGSIRVRVLDHEERAVPNADIAIGILRSSGERESKPAKTGADGTYTFTGLTFGDLQAYRVNVPFSGAKYSSNPFRLEAANGYDVTIRRLPVTREERMVVLYIGATSIELKDDRLKVVQQSRLLNLGTQTYVFPDKGAIVKLPPAFTAVITDEVMGDQQIEEAKGEGVRVTGSLPPGETTLMWGFDLPITGAEASFDIGLPWTTFAYRVISDAPPGLTLAVKEMPEPFVQRDSGRSFFITEMQRRVGDTPFRTVSIRLTGIPGPGPERWISLGVALGIAIGGLWIARRKAPLAAPAGSRRAGAVVPEELLARVRRLDAERASEAIGPEFHREQRQALIDELALQLLARADVTEEQPKR
jgi:hypothetical protein